MAIDRIAKVTIVHRKNMTQRLISRLNELGTVEVVGVREAHPQSEDDSLRPQQSHGREPEEMLHKLSNLVTLFDQFSPEPKSFVAGLAPVPLLVDQEEVTQAVQHFPLEETFQRAQALDEAHRHHERAIAQLEQEIAQLRPFADIPVPLQAVHRLHRIKARLVEVPKKSDEAFAGKLSAVSSLSMQRIPLAATVRFWLAYLPEDEPALLAVLKEARAQEIALPHVEGTVAERLRKLEEDLRETRQAFEETAEQIKALGKHRRSVLVLKAHWESELRKQQVQQQTLAGQWLSILSGYARERDIAELRTAVEKDFENTAVFVEVPGADEEVPVSITHGNFVRPISLLVNMYGLPRYSTFDPSPYLMVNFLLFFGICFGDVGYGLLLILSSVYLAYRAREYAHLKNFAILFLYGGISTVVFGALLGSWFGDLFDPKYLGQDNLLLKAKEATVVFEPLVKPVVALVLALAIGMLNQFYGIALKMGASIRGGDWAGAIFDSALWMVLLPGLVVVISTLFVKVPSAIMTVAIVLLVIGAVGLVLTQGRAEKTFLGKAVVGVISLYGIFGSYGATSFIGDTLSYCRLLALGLTTGIVAMSINLIGGMLMDVPYVGGILFVVVLVFGHLFNFAISVLGAFIHSARLIFVEFFGRFYESGARPFRPLSFNSPSYQTRR